MPYMYKAVKVTTHSSNYLSHSALRELLPFTMSNKNSMKKRARASNDSKATQESQPTDSDTCEDTGTQSEFMDFVRSSLNSLNGKFDAFLEKQEKPELRITAVEERVTSQEKAVEGVVESIDFTAEKVNNVWHSLESLQ